MKRKTMLDRMLTGQADAVEETAFVAHKLWFATDDERREVAEFIANSPLNGEDDIDVIKDVLTATPSSSDVYKSEVDAWFVSGQRRAEWLDKSHRFWRRTDDGQIWFDRDVEADELKKALKRELGEYLLDGDNYPIDNGSRFDSLNEKVRLLGHVEHDKDMPLL